MKFLTGNRCGHNPCAFRQPVFKETKNLPGLIEETIEEIRKNGIPGLDLRSELDEAVRAVTITLLHYSDLYSRSIGMPTKRGWKAFGWETVLKCLPWLSESRLWQALKVLRDNDLFDSNQRLYDATRISKDASKPSGYAVSDKFFTQHFWVCFRKLKRWQNEAKDKFDRVHNDAMAIGKTAKDFYKKAWQTTQKTMVKVLSAAGLNKPDENVSHTLDQIGPSANAIKMQLTAKLISLGFKDAHERASTLFEEFGSAALTNTEQFIS